MKEGSSSILVTGAGPAASSSHARLLKTVQSYSEISGLSIHILLVEGNTTPSPNVYLNLARMMAKTEWTLLIPSDNRHAVTQELYKRLSDLNLRTKTAPVILAPSSEIYPLPPSSLVLIQRDHDFWCTERVSLHGNRHSDWNECLWQLALETQGKLDTLKMSLKSSAEGPHSKSEVCQIHSAAKKTRYLDRDGLDNE